jgi:amphi-Trp domain-containing protein
MLGAWPRVALPAAEFGDRSPAVHVSHPCNRLVLAPSFALLGRMAQKTGTKKTMKREQLGEYPQDLGEPLAGEDEVTVRIENRNVTLRPSDSVNVEVEVTERSSLLRSNREKVSLDPSRKPTKKK